MSYNEYAAPTASSRARAANNAAADVSSSASLVANENTGGGNVNSASANSYDLFKKVMSNTKHKPGMMGKLNKQVSCSPAAVKSVKLSPALFTRSMFYKIIAIGPPAHCIKL